MPPTPSRRWRPSGKRYRNCALCPAADSLHSVPQSAPHKRPSRINHAKSANLANGTDILPPQTRPAAWRGAVSPQCSSVLFRRGILTPGNTSHSGKIPFGSTLSHEEMPAAGRSLRRARFCSWCLSSHVTVTQTSHSECFSEPYASGPPQRGDHTAADNGHSHPQHHVAGVAGLGRRSGLGIGGTGITGLRIGLGVGLSGSGFSGCWTPS